MKLLTWAGLATVLLMAGNAAHAAVADTKHNLSISGPGTIKASSESQICIFCHTPHNASAAAPLWNRRDPGSSYIPYSSTTAIANPGQPTGASILCLSCHDGTIALGEVLNQATDIIMSGGVTTLPAGDTQLETDLSDDHPISFDYTTSITSGGEYVDPSSLTGAVRLDAGGQMQCTSCHEPHDNTWGKFLVMPARASGLCTTCHIKNGWIQSPHNLSGATWNGQAADPWPATDWVTVADNGCQNCHQPHTSGSRERLLNYQAEEDNCAACHNGNVAGKDVMTVFNQFSSHPIRDTLEVHDPAEPGTIASRHVECADCHNPHAARAGSNAVTGPLLGVRGVDINGIEIDPIRETYQLCFRCHADSPGKPPAPTPRQIEQTNTRLEFRLTNPSFHPVAGPGRNPDVPSLISPLSPVSTIGCSDCHNSNAAPSAGGAGPEGPHGSAFEPILLRQYLTLDNTPESPSSYALCYSCHDRNSILADQSFSLHNQHIVEERTPCNVCHDPHGISDTQGNSINNTHLINFDISVVFPAMGSTGGLQFTDNGRFAGSCTLNCHGRQHMNLSYPGGSGTGGGGPGSGGTGGG